MAPHLIEGPSPMQYAPEVVPSVTLSQRDVRSREEAVRAARVYLLPQAQHAARERQAKAAYVETELEMQQ